MGAVVLGAEGRPLGVVVGGQTRVGRRDAGTLHLERVAADDAHERRPVGHQRREGDHVVLDDHVRLLSREDVAQLRLAVAGAVDERLPRGLP